MPLARVSDQAACEFHNLVPESVLDCIEVRHQRNVGVPSETHEARCAAACSCYAVREF